MKVLHICTSGEYTEGFSYQDNLITKYMSRSGIDTYIIASPLSYNSHGETVHVDVPCRYINKDGVKVTRLPFHKPERFGRFLRSLEGFYKEVQRIEPNVIFYHNPQTSDSAVIAKYCKKNPDVKVFADNHADFSNSATNWLSKTVLHGLIWRYYVNVLNKYTIRYYGVLPARVDFLKNVYKVPVNKCDLLVMGGDDEIVERTMREENRIKLRKKYHIQDDDFLIVTGGKIDAWKTQTVLLMQAVKAIDNPSLKLIVFGSVDKTLINQVNELTDGNRIQYIGWVQSNESYELFSISDLVVFPGRHSVYWEQVVAQGIPMIVKHWNGTTHVDIGGNVRYLYKDDMDEIRENIRELMEKPEQYKCMLEAARSDMRKAFLYSSIAKRSIHVPEE